MAKIILSRVPLGYRLWRRLVIFRHGKMHVPSYSIGVVASHVEKLGGAGRMKGAVCLELGPGDSLASALIACAYGCARIYLVDAGAFANRDLAMYRRLADALATHGLPKVNLATSENVEAMLAVLDARYLTEGLKSLKAIESGSVDFIWSQAVLEHVRRHEIDAVFAEFRRVLKPGGAMSHRIDFKDHLGGSLNNLRFSRRLWESEFMSRSGFYTNRLRPSAMLGAMRRAGFSFTIRETVRWEALPLPRTKMDPEFRDLPDEDLLVSGCDLVARPI